MVWEQGSYVFYLLMLRNSTNHCIWYFNNLLLFNFSFSYFENSYSPKVEVLKQLQKQSEHQGLTLQ